MTVSAIRKANSRKDYWLSLRKWLVSKKVTVESSIADTTKTVKGFIKFLEHVPLIHLIQLWG